MKLPFTLTDFSGGMKGKKGQLNSADTKYVQDLNNLLVERNNSLKTRNGVSTLPITLLANDKVIPFTHNGRKFYFVYDPLLILKYGTPNETNTNFSYSMGGQRHVDMFSKENSSMSPLKYLRKERANYDAFMQSDTNITYLINSVGLPAQDDVTKWQYLKDFDTSTALPSDYEDLHKYLRKLTWESSPSFVRTGIYYAQPQTDLSVLLQISNGHPVVENTFWWNRMFVLDADFNVITTEIDIANFVSYDSGHAIQESLSVMDTEVRNATHAELKDIREARYGGSDLTYEVEVMNQGVMFYNREGKLPNMFMQINSEGATDGILRDFRTLYLDEVPNGIFKTVPYFTDSEYTSYDLVDDARLEYEMDTLTTPWNLSADARLPDQIAIDDIFDYLDTETVFDLATNDGLDFSYDVRDSENNSDVLKAFLPLTSDSSPALAIDNVRFDEPDGQVRFCSPTLANMDRDFVFPHDVTSVWQNAELADDLPFIFSPNLVIYFNSPTLGKVTASICTLQNNATTDDTFCLIPISRFAGAAIGKFNDASTTYRPVRITAMTDSATKTTSDAAYAATQVFTQMFRIIKYNALLEFEFASDSGISAPNLGYFLDDGTYYAVSNFKAFATIYSGNYSKRRSGLFSSTSQRSNYSFRIDSHDGGNVFSIVYTNENQLSRAIGFNSDSYFSSVVEFEGRMYLASKEAPDRLIYSSTNDYLEFSTVRSLVNAETDSVATRGGRELFGNEAIEALHEANSTLRVITDKRILSAGASELGIVVLSDPSDIVTSGQEPVTINNFTYFVSGDKRDILLSVFSDKTQRFEYYSVFSAINIDDETLILDFLSIDAAYRMVVRTEEAIYVGTIIQANQVAWSRLTFNFDVISLTSTVDSLYLSSADAAYVLNFIVAADLEDGVVASLKLLAPTAMANLVNLAKTNINYIGLRYHDLTLVGSFESAVATGSDARPQVSSELGDVIDIMNKNYNDIYDSIEITLEGKQNRIIYLRGSLGV